MSSFNRALEVRYSPERMFALVDRIEDYPLYLPWCARTKVDRRAGGEVLATMYLRRGALHHSFATRNLHDSAGRRIDVQLARGPLSFLHGQWRFLPLAGGGCRVEFDIDYEFANRPLTWLLTPMFNSIYSRMIDAFAARARQVHGDGRQESTDGTGTD